VEFGAVDLVNTNWFASASGTQSLDLNSADSGGVYQDATTSPGESYRLRFAFGGNTHENGNPAGGPPVKQMQVLWGTNVLGTLSYDVTGHSPTDVGWREFSFTVIGNGNDRVIFRSLTHGWAGPAIDNVSLKPSTNSIPMVSGLTIETIEHAVRICWPTEPGMLYQVQWASRLDTNVWNYLGASVLGDGTTNCICDPLGSDSMRVFRVLQND
jgi:hypothetical protein